MTVLYFSDYNVKESVIERPWSAIIEPLEKIESPLNYAWGVTSHLNGVRNSQELRSAYEKVTRGLNISILSIITFSCEVIMIN